MKKRLFIALFIFGIITTLSFIVINSLDNNKKQDINMSVDKNSSKPKKKEIDNQKEKEETKKLEEEIKISEVTTNKEIKDNKKSGNKTDSQNSKQDNQKVEIKNNSNSSKNNESIINNPVKNEAPTPKTEWEKLGISREEYENAKLLDYEQVAYKNLSDCINEAKRIEQEYNYVTNYGGVSGKYVNTVGCWVKVHIGNKSYYLNEFRNLGY